MTELKDYQWFQLRSAPLPPSEGGVSLSTQLVAALTACHAELSALGETADKSFAVLWMRTRRLDAMRFLLGGRPVLPLVEGDHGPERDAHVFYPPGATGVTLPAGDVDRTLEAFPHWVRCLGQADALLLPASHERDRQTPRGSFEDYVAVLDEPFAWLVSAEPLPREALDDERLGLVTNITLLRRKENSERDRLHLEQAQARYRELTRSRAAGMWNVTLLVGGLSINAVKRSAGLLCGASQMEGIAYSLLPADQPASLDKAIRTLVVEDDNLNRGTSPFPANGELLAALARPPIRELPGIRLVAPHRFDVTPEAPTTGLVLGEVVDAARRAVGPLRVTTETLNRHTFICGATGSGKSQTARGLLESLSTAEPPTPWLVVEPAKAEYARMSGRLTSKHDVLVIRPGDPQAPPASLNPLEPEPGYPLQSHADLVRALFLAAFEAHEPFPQVLSRALTESYQRAGWNLVTSELINPPGTDCGSAVPAVDDSGAHICQETAEERRARKYPTLRDLQSTARRVVDNIGYGKEIAADVRGFVDVRIGSLREGTPGRFFEGGHPLDVAALLERNVVLELDPVTSDQDKAFLIGAVLIRITEHLRVKHRNRDAAGLNHVLLIEEAHRLLKNVQHGPAAAAVSLFASLLAEIRAYGEGVVIVEQIPAKILPDVIKNTAMKVMHRLPAQDDRAAVGATMNLSVEQSEAVVSFTPGLAAVAFDGADRPLLVQMTEGVAREATANSTATLPLRRSRSALCPSGCRQRPCTLDEVSAACDLAREPTHAFWVEAVTASLVMGLAPPLPRAHHLATWPSQGRRRDCALAEAVDRAVGARQQELRRWLNVEDFAKHLHRVITTVHDSGRMASIEQRDRWRAGPYRWSDVLSALRKTVELCVDPGPERTALHRSTGDWERRGLKFSARTLAEQLAQLEADPSHATDGREVALGDTAVSGLDAALLALAGGTTRAHLDRVASYTLAGESHVLLSYLQPYFPEAGAAAPPRPLPQEHQ